MVCRFNGAQILHLNVDMHGMTLLLKKLLEYKRCTETLKYLRSDHML